MYMVIINIYLYTLSPLIFIKLITKTINKKINKSVYSNKIYLLIYFKPVYYYLIK